MCNSTLHHVEQDTWTLFVELKQIPGVIVIYRRPCERIRNFDKISLDERGFKRLPLLEGEEKLKYLNLSNNAIRKIENIVSLPIMLQPIVKSLRVLILGKNEIAEIKNLECMPNLDVLDLHDNKIKQIENLRSMTSLRVLNLSNNLIEILDINHPLPSLVELNLRRNQISEVKDLKELTNL